MAYNPVTGSYDPDTNDFSNWFQMAGQQQQQPNPNLNYIYGNQGQSQQPGMIGDGTVPYNPAGGQQQSGRPDQSNVPGQAGNPGYNGYPPSDPNAPMDPNSPYFQEWLRQHSGNPTAPNPYSDGSGNPITGTNKPNGVDFSSPTTVPSLTSSLPQPVVGTGNSGTDRNNPPGPGYFWSGTANHWVDPSGQHDATGRLLSQGEQDYWHQYDVSRASNTAQGIPTAVPPPPGPNQLPANGQVAPAATVAAPAQPAAATATAASPYDYSKWQSVPGYTFEKNVFADSNAKQSFLELQGVMNADQLQKAKDLYGWQKAVEDTTADANEVYARAIEMAKADPNSDYSIVRVGMSDGSVGYGVLKRENGGGNVAAMQKAQTDRGFISPAVAIAMAQAQKEAQAQAQAKQQNSGGGGRPNYPSGGGGGTPKTTASLPAPAGKTTIQPGPSIDTRMVGGQVNMNQPVEGQIINYNGQMVQYRQGRWVPLAYNGGSQQHASPV